MIGMDVDKAASCLLAGELVAIPTETVYGLAANAFDDRAVAEIFRVKNRPHFDPLIVHTDRLERISDFAEWLPEQAYSLAQQFMPGPLTLLLPRKTVIPDLVTAGLPRVAVRIPQHPLTRDLLSRLPFPLAAPSANPFGYISPTRAEHVPRQLGKHAAYILDGGPCTVGVESTILGFEEHGPVVWRKGGLPIEAIEALIGPLSVNERSTDNPLAPGLLKSHYAPRTPIVFGKLSELLKRHQHQRIGVLCFQDAPQHPAIFETAVLSPEGDLNEAARHLFAEMRRLDEAGLDFILAEWVPDTGLGRAINDRLARAAAE